MIKMMLKMKWWTVAFLCQVLQEPWNFQSRQGRHPHNFQSDTDRVVFGMAADCFRISNFTLWLHGVYVAPAVIETAHTIMNGKLPKHLELSGANKVFATYNLPLTPPGRSGKRCDFVIHVTT